MILRVYVRIVVERLNLNKMEKIPIIRQGSAVLYGTVIDPKTKRIGRFGVKANGKDTGGIYNMLVEAEKKFASAISTVANISSPPKRKH